MFESTATWAEEFRSIRDDRRLPRLRAGVRRRPGHADHRPSAADAVLQIYGAAVWNHWLDSAAAVTASTWSAAPGSVSDRDRPADFALAAYDARDRRRRRARASARSSPVRRRDRRVAHGLRRLSRRRRVSRREAQGLACKRRAPAASALDHTAYRLLDVEAARPAARSGSRSRSSAASARGIALVARDGDPLGGTVTAQAQASSATAARRRSRSRSPARFERITAVLVNADGRVKGFARPATGSTAATTPRFDASGSRADRAARAARSCGRRTRPARLDRARRGAAPATAPSRPASPSREREQQQVGAGAGGARPRPRPRRCRPRPARRRRGRR